MNKLAARILRGAILLGWMLAIYYFSDQANSNKVSENLFGSLNYFVRKGAHITEYSVLYLLAYWFQLPFFAEKPMANSEPDLKKRLEHELSQGNEPIQESGRKNFLQKCALPIVLSIVYAITDEWHQSFVPGRSPLASDVLIDSCGVGIAALLSWIFAA